MPNSKKRTDYPTKEQKIAARQIAKTIAKKQSGLPASFDECMAFFTGYRETKVGVKSQAEFIDLASRCANYCERLHDRESLHLLMYAVIRRVNKYKPISGPGQSLLTLLDMIVGDSTRLYSDVYDGNTATQVKDMAVLFKAWLSFAKANKPNIDLNPLVSSTKKATTSELTKAQSTTLPPPTKTPAPTSVKALPPLWDTKQKGDISFTRGGGLYAFLDMKKGLSTGFKNDNYNFSGVYVTPKGLLDRDHFYAYDPNRCRAFLDMPSKQEAHIPSDFLYQTNHNRYEGFILHQDFNQIQNLTLSFFPDTHYKPGFLINRYDLTEIQPYLSRDSAATLKRVEQMVTLLNSPSEGMMPKKQKMHLEQTFERHQKALDDRLSKPVTLMKKHSENYLNSIPKSKQAGHQKFSLIQNLYNVLNNEKKLPLVNVIEAAKEIIRASKKEIEAVQDPKKAFLRGVGLMGLKAITFNQAYQDKPFLFFGSHGGILLSELEKELDITESIISETLQTESKEARP